MLGWDCTDRRGRWPQCGSDQGARSANRDYCQLRFRLLSRQGKAELWIVIAARERGEPWTKEDCA
jgi:hypothetical protein